MQLKKDPKSTPSIRVSRNYKMITGNIWDYASYKYLKRKYVAGQTIRKVLSCDLCQM